MSLTGFDILRKRHPESEKLVSALETQIQHVLEKDPAAVLDPAILAGQLDTDEEPIYKLLIELTAAHVLRSLFTWNCPESFGGLLEGEDPQAFPDWATCPRCGHEHEFRQRDVQVTFRPGKEFEARRPREADGVTTEG